MNATISSTSTRVSGDSWGSDMPFSAPGPVVGDQPFVVALGDSIIGLHAQSDIVKRMIALYRETDAKVVVAFEEVPAADVDRFGIAKPARANR